MTSEQLHRILKGAIPNAALDYCCSLQSKYPFRLRISNKRKTKLGDYRFDPSKKSHTISVNADLNPFNFLITFIHESAHCVTTYRYGRKPRPHGSEWKSTFQELMLPLLNDAVFPDAILRPLAQHMRNPKASSYSDLRLVKALRQYDETPHTLLLSELPTGESFELNERSFQKLSTRRTRAVCRELTTGKNFLISIQAPINPL